MADKNATAECTHTHLEIIEGIVLIELWELIFIRLANRRRLSDDIISDENTMTRH